jgi:hypothetical protein
MGNAPSAKGSSCTEFADPFAACGGGFGCHLTLSSSTSEDRETFDSSPIQCCNAHGALAH